MPIRNPFGRRPGVPSPHDENVRPGSASGDAAHLGFQKVDTVGSAKSQNIAGRRSQDTGEYKMSVVNDSGIYLPPSPVEREVSWPKRYLSSRSSTDTRGDVREIEPFSISRESFDSYRRSFDISARSPIAISDPAPRQSLDSARFPRRQPRSALADRHRANRPPTTAEEFEDVGLGDDGTKQQQHPKKRGFLSKFTAASDPADPSAPHQQQHQQQQPPSMAARFLTGRKRGQSGQGSELGAMPRSPTDAHKSAGSVVDTQEVDSVTTS